MNVAPHYVETVFHDGRRVVATPEAGNSAYNDNARALGYGDDLELLSREHEMLHTFLAERIHGGASPTLWAVAHGQGNDPNFPDLAPIWEQIYEEAMVLAFQKYMNTGAVDEALRDFAVSDLESLRAEALAILRGR